MSGEDHPDHEHGHAELSPAARERIRATVGRLARPAVRADARALGRLARALRRERGLPAGDAARGAKEVARLLELEPAARYAGFLTRPELARPAVVLALYDRTRAAIITGASEAPALARLGLAVTAGFSGEHHAASLTLDHLGEGWLLLALAHLATRRLAEAVQAFDIAFAVLQLSESSTGDANLNAESLLTEGLIELAAGNRVNAVQCFQEAVSEYAGAGEADRARVAALLFADTSAGRCENPDTSEMPSRCEPAAGPLAHVLAVWRIVESSPPTPESTKEQE